MFSKKRVEKKRGMYITISIFVLLATLYFGFNIYETFSKYYESKKRLTASKESFAQLEKQYQELIELQKLEDSTTGYEMRVRSKFDLVKEGEKVVFITNEVAPETQPEETQIQKMFNLFKNLFE